MAGINLTVSWVIYGSLMSKNKFFKLPLGYEGKVLSYYKFQQQVQNELLLIIRSSLPDHLANHALYCVATRNKILLYTDSAIWSSQLRFYHQQMLQSLLASKQGSFEVLQIKIIPSTVEKKGEAVKIPSKENINGLLNQAENQRDVVLKTALLKLARTLNKLSKTDSSD